MPTKSVDEAASDRMWRRISKQQEMERRGLPNKELIEAVEPPTYTGIDKARAIISDAYTWIEKGFEQRELAELRASLFADPLNPALIEDKLLWLVQSDNLDFGKMNEAALSLVARLYYHMLGTMALIPDQLLPDLKIEALKPENGITMLGAYNARTNSITVDISAIMQDVDQTQKQRAFIKQVDPFDILLNQAIGIFDTIGHEMAHLVQNVLSSVLSGAAYATRPFDAKVQVYFPKASASELAALEIPDTPRMQEEYDEQTLDNDNGQRFQRLEKLFDKNPGLRTLFQLELGKDMDMDFETIYSKVYYKVLEITDRMRAEGFSEHAVSELFDLEFGFSFHSFETYFEQPKEIEAREKERAMFEQGNTSLTVEAGGARGPLKMPLDEAARSVFFGQLTDAAMQRKAQLLADPADVSSMLGGGAISPAVISSGIGDMAVPNERSRVMLERDLARGIADVAEKAAEATRAIEKGAERIEITVRK